MKTIFNEDRRSKFLKVIIDTNDRDLILTTVDILVSEGCTIKTLKMVEQVKKIFDRRQSGNGINPKNQNPAV